jgi:phosphotransferase system HPr-like phosphotransfer protein
MQIRYSQSFPSCRWGRSKILVPENKAVPKFAQCSGLGTLAAEFRCKGELHADGNEEEWAFQTGKFGTAKVFRVADGEGWKILVPENKAVPKFAQRCGLGTLATEFGCKGELHADGNEEEWAFQTGKFGTAKVFRVADGEGWKFRVPENKAVPKFAQCSGLGTLAAEFGCKGELHADGNEEEWAF